MAVIAVVAMAGACASPRVAPPSGAGPSAASATAVPSPAVLAPRGTPSPAPTTVAAVAAATEVTGTATCTWAEVTVSAPDADGTRHTRGARAGCAVQANDARATGTRSETYDANTWGDERAAASVRWGTSRLANADGAWEGTFTGVRSSDRGDITAFWYRGTGGYTGLGYFELDTGAGPDLQVRGLVFPGDPPRIPSVPTPAETGVSPGAPPGGASGPALPPSFPPAPAVAAVSYGPATSVAGTSVYTTLDLGSGVDRPGGITAFPDGVFAGVQGANDPRASFAFETLTWMIELWGGSFETGRGIQWGTDVRTVSGGTWLCTDYGIYDSNADTIVFVCRGTGTMAGLGYVELGASVDPFGLPSDPTTKVVTHGLVFPGDPPMP